MRTFSFLLLALSSSIALAQHGFEAPAGKPDAIVDLRSDEDAKLVAGQWRYADAKIVEVDHHGVGADLKASGPTNRTNDIEPRAGSAGFDDSKWESIPASSLEQRRGNGKLSFNWYRINVTIPENVGEDKTAGMSVVFETVIDDYAEIWVNGKLPRVLGQSGGSLVKGWNAPNRVILTHNAKAGEKFQIAIFGINAPLSNPPATFIWARSATLDFYKPGRDNPGVEVPAEIVRNDPAIDQIIPSAPKVEKIADGFGFTEGPVWIPATDDNDGYLLFSDPNNNTIYSWSADGQVSVYRAKSGYTGVNIGEYHQPGSNRLTLDSQGRLTIDEHGNRRVTRLETNGTITVLADRFEGKRLNSPNDLVYRSDGALYFTDPPFGLPKAFGDPGKELSFSGVFVLKDGHLKLAAHDLAAPNGLAFSPDEKHLYVDNWEINKKVVMRYDVAADGSLSNGSVFFDMTDQPGEIALDGLKVDTEGNIYVSGPGGVWIISSTGRHLGTIKTPELPANITFGGDDGKTLFLCARTGVYRMRVNVAGIHPMIQSESKSESRPR